MTRARASPPSNRPSFFRQTARRTRSRFWWARILRNSRLRAGVIPQNHSNDASTGNDSAEKNFTGKLALPDGNKGARGAQRGGLLNCFLGTSCASVSTAASLLCSIRLPRLTSRGLLTLKIQSAERPGRVSASLPLL